MEVGTATDYRTSFAELRLTLRCRLLGVEFKVGPHSRRVTIAVHHDDDQHNQKNHGFVAVPIHSPGYLRATAHFLAGCWEADPNNGRSGECVPMFVESPELCG